MVLNEVSALNIINNAFRNSGYEIFLVGGCVRDKVMGNIPKDYDLATNAKPNEIISICEKYKIAAYDSGMKYGTVTLLVNDIPFEVTTFRKDVY